VISPANLLTEKLVGRTDRRVATTDGFVAVECSEPTGDFALALAVLSRLRLASEGTRRAKLDGIARMEAPSKISA